MNQPPFPIEMPDVKSNYNVISEKAEPAKVIHDFADPNDARFAISLDDEKKGVKKENASTQKAM